MAEEQPAGARAPITSRRAWAVVGLVGLMVVVGAVAVGLLVRPDALRQVATGETLSLAAPPPTRDGSISREVVLDGGVGVRLTTNDALGDARDLVPPDGGTFVVARVSDSRWASGAPDVVGPPTTTVTLVDGERRFDLTPGEAPTSRAGPPPDDHRRAAAERVAGEQRVTGGRATRPVSQHGAPPRDDRPTVIGTTPISRELSTRLARW